MDQIGEVYKQSLHQHHNVVFRYPSCDVEKGQKVKSVSWHESVENKVEILDQSDQKSALKKLVDDTSHRFVFGGYLRLGLGCLVNIPWMVLLMTIRTNLTFNPNN